jgi:hypothetical protein
MTPSRCPRCEFAYAWDGHNCTHCHRPIPTRASWASFASLVTFAHAHQTRDRRKAILVACAFVRRAASVLSPPAVELLERAEAYADASGPPVRPILRDLRGVDHDPVYRAEEAARAALRMCGSADVADRDLRQAAAHARAAVAWAAFPEREWYTFPLPPGFERYRPTLDPSGDVKVRRRSVGRDEAHELLNRANSEHMSRRADRERDEESAQCRLYRDVYGYPFEVVTFERAWRTSTVLGLCRQMYDTHDFSGMPVLADALQDAGCDHDEILGHCREPGEHARGCWVVDLALGKS